MFTESQGSKIIQVVGMGVGDTGTLGTSAIAAIEQAELIIGATYHLSKLPELSAEKLPYPRPMSGLWDLLCENFGKSIVILASGDPLFFGISSTLLNRFPSEHLVFHPNVSSIQVAFARLGQPWQQAQWINLHGRPISILRATLKSNMMYALLTDRDSSPNAIARILVETGFGKSDIWVAENLGTDKERFSFFQANNLDAATNEFSALNIVILKTCGPGGVLPEFPGIPDTWFSTGKEPGRGMLSKREVRLAILSLISPRAGEIGWDIGAGCGGISIEWARWNPYGEVYAVEYHKERLKHLEINRERFGVISNLHIIPRRAAEAWIDLPKPQAVFIGGSSGSLGLVLQEVWERLQPGGRLVASAVTEDSKIDIYNFIGQRSAELIELSIARNRRIDGYLVMRPHLPVLLMKLEKSE
jgi:precorrin-6Y C5,15-methyltransferase (decarboxylating)